MVTTIPLTTSLMRTTSSLRPTITTINVMPSTSPRCKTTPAETIRVDGGGPMHCTTTLEVQDMDITAPERDICHGVYPDFQLPLPNRPRISDLFVGNTQLVSDTNSPVSILCIPNLKKMCGTSEHAIDRNTGQLCTIGDIDITPINVFGGIPDDDMNGQAPESTLVPPKTPQATSTPIMEVPRSVEEASVPSSKVSLPTPKMVTITQEMESWTSCSSLSEPSGPAPIFNLNRANVRAVSSISSLGEDEGIINNDEYEHAVCRIEKINLKISTLIKNWSEESKSAKTPEELVEMDMFY